MSLAIMGSHSVTRHPTQVNTHALTPAVIILIIIIVRETNSVTELN